MFKCATFKCDKETNGVASLYYNDPDKDKNTFLKTDTSQHKTSHCCSEKPKCLTYPCSKENGFYNVGDKSTERYDPLQKPKALNKQCCGRMPLCSAYVCPSAKNLINNLDKPNLKYNPELTEENIELQCCIAKEKPKPTKTCTNFFPHCKNFKRKGKGYIEKGKGKGCPMVPDSTKKAKPLPGSKKPKPKLDACCKCRATCAARC